MNRFVIISAARSGSSLLATALATHSAVSMHGEVFHANGLFWQGEVAPATDGGSFVARQIYATEKYKHPVTAIGFKLLYGQAHSRIERSVWQYLASNTQIRLIHPVRVNLLDSLISLRTALVTGEWYRQSTEAPRADPVKIYLSPRDTYNYFTSILNARRRIHSSFERHLIIEIDYEQHLRNELDNTLMTVQAFLDIKSEQLTSPLIRQSVLRRHEAVLNYDELYEFFRATPYAVFFDDAS